jgi:hypothetical protein
MKKLRNKNNVIFYFDETTNKQVSEKQGRKAYISENVDLISRGIVPYEDLNTSEKLSYHAQKRLKFNNEFITKTDEIIVRKQAKNFNIDLPAGVDLSNAFKTGSIKDITKGFSETFFRQQGEMKNNVMFSMTKSMIQSMENGDTVKVITESGETLYGNEAIEYVDEFISDTMEEADKQDKSPIINFEEELTVENGINVHTINLSNAYRELK